MATTGRTPLRRDAERNRRRIVDEAGRLVARGGLQVSHDDIARAAEVGVGTVYRRFPAREVLLEELLGDRVERTVAGAQEAARSDDAWSGLTAFFDEVVVTQAADRGMRELLSGSPHAPALARRAREAIAPVVAGLLQRAQAEGAVRPEVGVTDLALVPLMTATVLPAGDLALARRVLAVLLAGLQPGPPGAAPLPGTPASPALLDHVLSGTSPQSFPQELP